ncbi:ATP-grasp domain-containing protein [Niallia sp. 03133]|uniref:ATP-grasp domain-containing protein n=1 Tax=Niallia sp. 03133 TaxID=3458060 RepID=UPI004044B2C4
MVKGSNSYKKRMIMIGGWTRLYQKAVNSGFELTVIQEKNQVKLEDLSLIDQLITMSLDDLKAIGVLKYLHKEKPFHCVVSMQEKGLLTAAYIRKALNIMGNPLAPVLLTKNKGEMRKHLDKNKMKTIPYKLIMTKEDVLHMVREYGYPIILKPVDGSGSRQIHKIENIHQIDKAFFDIKSEYDSFLLAEKFIEGQEISVEAFSWNGEHTVIAMTDKLTTGSPYFVETGHIIPSSLTQELFHKISDMTSKFLSSIGHMMGPSHTEMIIDNGEAYLIESHTRAGGDFIYDLVELSYGIDMFSLLFEGLAGEVPIVQRKKDVSVAAIQYLHLPEGTIKHIHHTNEVRLDPDIKRYEINLYPGKKIKSFSNSSERYGYFLAVGSTKEEVFHKINASIEKFQIEMD